MKKVIIVMLFFVLTGNTFAKKEKEEHPIVGIWKYSNQSATNEFQKVLNDKGQDYSYEYFVFESGCKFQHEFRDYTGKVVKILKGKWKVVGDKIKIEYADIDYSVTVNFFFLDTDLVLGQNFNHVIFTKDLGDTKNIALK